MSILTRLSTWLSADGPPASPPGPLDDYWYQPYSGGEHLTEEQAMRISAVYACTTLIAQAIACLPVMVYQRRGGGVLSDVEAPNHPLNYVLRESANDYWTSTEFWEAFVGDMVRTGNGYARINLDSRNDVSSLDRLSPDAVTPEVSTVTGVKFYRVQKASGGEEQVRADAIFHAPGNGYDGVKGYSPIDTCARAFSLSATAEEYGHRFFTNGATPPHYIYHPEGTHWTHQSQENISRWFQKKFGGVARSHKLGVLYGGAEIKSVPINHRDIQFLELRNFQVEEIARIYRVPLHMIGSLERATNNNIEHQAIEFVKYTLLPWVRKIEARISHSLLGPLERGRFLVKFDLDGLMRGDSAARAAYIMALRNAGVLGGNECRESEGFSPRPECEGVLVQGAMIPIEMAGKLQSKEKESQDGTGKT